MSIVTRGFGGQAVITRGYFDRWAIEWLTRPIVIFKRAAVSAFKHVNPTRRFKRGRVE